MLGVLNVLLSFPFLPNPGPEHPFSIRIKKWIRECFSVKCISTSHDLFQSTPVPLVELVPFGDVQFIPGPRFNHVVCVVFHSLPDLDYSFMEVCDLQSHTGLSMTAVCV